MRILVTESSAPASEPDVTKRVPCIKTKHELRRSLRTSTGQWLEYVDWADSVLVEPLRIEKGLTMPSLRPGLGMAWNEKAVKKYLV